MKNHKLFGAALLGLTISASGVANAGIINFNDLNISSRTSLSNPFDYNGLTFLGSNLSSFSNDTWNMNGDGTDYIGWYSNTADLMITETNSEMFSLFSLQIGQLIWNGSGGTASITGTVAGGGTLTKYVSITESFTDVSFTGWDNLTSVAISGPKFWMALDNVNFTSDSTSVPEPSPFAILALGLMGLATQRLRKQS